MNAPAPTELLERLATMPAAEAIRGSHDWKTIMDSLRQAASVERAEVAGEAVTAAQLIAWFKSRPGTPWEVTIRNIEKACAALASPSRSEGVSKGEVQSGEATKGESQCAATNVSLTPAATSSGLVTGTASSSSSTAPATTLPESVRIPLNSLQADLGYLIGRVIADGSCGPMIIKSMRERLDQIEAAIPTVAQEASGCGANALEKALTDCQIFSRTSSKSHQLVLEFTTLEGMQHARDIIIKASVPEVREFAQSGSTSKVIEACAKIAEPWPGFWLDKNSTDADRAVVEVRKEIAAKIRAMALPSAHRCARCGCETKGEVALLGDQEWCHPCADSIELPSAHRGGE